MKPSDGLGCPLRLLGRKEEGMGLQDVKDTFYAVLRDRVGLGNAGRTVVVRGVVRPGVVVVENELPGTAVDGIAVAECFCLSWTALGVDADGLVRLKAEVRYASDGSVGAGGMDRGRGLGAMDAELRTALGTAPQNAAAIDVTEALAGAAVETAVGSRIFWSDVMFGVAAMKSERMERIATVEVFGYE